MKKTGSFFILAAITLLYNSCGDASLFSTADTFSYKIIVDSHQDGSIVQAGENINLKIGNPDDGTTNVKPTSLTVVLYSAETGQKIAENTLQPIQIEEHLTLNFTDIKTGQYRLSFLLNNQDTVLTEKTMTIFYTEGKYTINSIKSLPSLINPDSRVLLAAEFILPKVADPYLKWSSNGILLNQGFLKDGLDKIYWQAPQEVGVYTVTLEVFPVRPVEGEQLAYRSQLIMNTELYVTAQKAVSERELNPVESYFALFHFNDNLIDSVKEWKKITRGRNSPGDSGISPHSDAAGYPGSASEAEPLQEVTEPTAIGELKFVSFGKEMGYQLNGSSGIHIPYLIVPAGQAGVQPFTLSLGLSFDELQPHTGIIALSTEAKDFSLQLFIDATLCPAVRITKEGREFNLSSGIKTLKIGQPYFLSFSVYPENKGFFVRWFLDGLLYDAQFVSLPLDGVTGRGETVIGGEKGFKGVIDELGVYYRTAQKQPGTDPYLFRDAMQRKYSYSLVFAHGFDGFILPADLKTEGRVQTDGIHLQLDSQARFILPGLEVKKEPLRILANFGKETTISCDWQEQGLTLNTAIMPGHANTPQTPPVFQTRIVMLEITPDRRATVKKPVLQNNPSALHNEEHLFNGDDLSKYTWETMRTLAQPVFTNQSGSQKEFSLIISNTQAAPLYIDSILVYID